MPCALAKACAGRASCVPNTQSRMWCKTQVREVLKPLAERKGRAHERDTRAGTAVCLRLASFVGRCNWDIRAALAGVCPRIPAAFAQGVGKTELGVPCLINYGIKIWYSHNTTINMGDINSVLKNAQYLP